MCLKNAYPSLQRNKHPFRCSFIFCYIELFNFSCFYTALPEASATPRSPVHIRYTFPSLLLVFCFELCNLMPNSFINMLSCSLPNNHLIDYVTIITNISYNQTNWLTKLDIILTLYTASKLS